nr:MAG: hypothetical protein 3 [Leviviridae sp.]
MKSYVTFAVSIYEGILKDAAIRWPSLQSSFEGDLSYLRRAVEHRGLPFLTITLPDACKVLDRGLDNGHLVPEDMPQGMHYRLKGPKLFGGLFNLVFDNCDVLRSDPDIEAIAFLRQLLCCMKKLRIQCKPSRVKDTIDEFFSIEADLPPSYPDTWDCNIPVWRYHEGHPLWGNRREPSEGQLGLFSHDWTPVDTLPWASLASLCRRIVSRLGTPRWWELRPKHGPGTVSEAKEGGLKYEFPYWPRKLELMFPFDWHGSGLLIGDVPNNREPFSRLIAVPKSQKGPRLICAEPIAHQWIQQGILRWLEKALMGTHLRHSINFTTQEISQKRALRSSIDGQLATVDLSAASDRLSTRLVEYIFQGSDILDGLHACRTRGLMQDLEPSQPRLTKLRKFSTMGSALTFPIQSIVFAILAVWAVRLADGKWAITSEEDLEETFREVTVYGDDIIIPTRALETIKLVLHECGLKVNVNKTYGGSNFRESCGCDAFRGVDVTPAYALHPYDDSPTSMATTVAESNNFFKKGYWNTSEAIVSQIPPQERKLLRVCGSEDGNFGLFSFVGSSTEHLRRGWDKDLQKEYSISLTVRSKVDRVRGRGTADLTQYFTEHPSPDIIWAAGQVSGVRITKTRTRVYDL